MKTFTYHRNSLLTWFRIFGYGLCIRNMNSSRFYFTFSERMGYTKYIQIFGRVITIIKPDNFLK